MNGRSSHSGNTSRLKIGLLRLTDSAPVIVACELGYFAEEGVQTELMVEPSWANIADKLAYGFSDAAVILPPLAFAITLGLRQPAQSLVVPFSISMGGNTVTLSRELADEVQTIALRDHVPLVNALAATLTPKLERPVFAVVHNYSTHDLLLRYWLATAGIIAGRNADLVVIPPQRMVEALQTRRVSGFCAGAPWGEMAVRAGAGTTVATSRDIWRNAPEKVFALRQDWAESHPGMLEGAVRALLRAARFCDAPENAAYTAALLSRPDYLGVDSQAILSSLPGAVPAMNRTVFHRHAATFPWRSHAQWFLGQMQRWGLLDARAQTRTIADRIYRPDLYRRAVAATGESVPVADVKPEGAHRSTWSLDASPRPIAMDADYFCDGAVFEPSD